MTHNAPEFGTPYPAEQRLGSDLALDPAYQAPAFTAPREGHGRWCVIYAQGGATQLGILWSGDNGSIGFIPSSDAGVKRIPEFYRAFSRAKGAKAKARDVFSDWAGRASLGLSAGPVEEGDLATLPE